MYALYRCYTELDDWNPMHSTARLGRLAKEHLMLYCELRKESKSEFLWKLMPNHHLLIHMAEESTVNPRLEWNYNDESAIGAAATLAAKCNVNYIPTHLIETYRCTLRLQSSGC